MKPFYIIAHRVNQINEIEGVLRKGANAIELDIRRTSGDLIVSHNAPDFNPVPLEQYLNSLAGFAEIYAQLSLIIFDVKGIREGASLELLNTIRDQLTSRVDINILISVGKYSDRNFFLPIIGAGLREREGIAIDGDNNPYRVADFFQSQGITNYAYGNGITVIAPGPNVPNSILNAIADKALRRTSKMVYVWTIRRKRAFRNYLRMGLDGIMVNENRIDNLIGVLGETEFQEEYRLATREDNPFLLQSIPSYVLNVQTADRRHAGTDARLSFILNGTRGSLSKTIHSRPYGLFERGDLNRVTLSGQDIGAITSLELSRNTSGIAPGWYVDNVQVESAMISLEMPLNFRFDSWIPRIGLIRNTGSTEYRIRVKTSKKLLSGTDANITFRIQGTGLGDSGSMSIVYSISADGKIFERGKTNQRTFRDQDIGTIRQLTISHDGVGRKSDWRVVWVKISTPNQEKHFTINQWIKANRPITI